MTSKLKEGVMQGVFTLCACVSILAVALICIFLFANGVPTLFKIGPLKFLLGTTWKPGNDIFGILPMILGSIYVTAGAILVGVPIGLLTAIYMSKFAPPPLYLRRRRARAKRFPALRRRIPPARKRTKRFHRKESFCL
jgi:phosphate transport system permease protein